MATGSNAEDDIEVRCGYGKCRPTILQKFNNTKVMMVVLCFYVFTYGFIVNGVFNVIVSTLERRFQLQSTQMGFVASAFDFSAAFFGIVISYLGSGRYKARWLAVSAIFMVLGSVTMTLPHFTTDLYEWGEDEISTCDLSGDKATTSATCVSSDLQKYVWLFTLSKVLFGIGGATMFTVGVAYIDDSVTSLMSPLYLGIYFGFTAFGSGTGYAVGGIFLNTYVDVDRVDTNSIALGTADPRWVGAWWVGPIMSAVIFVIACLALSCFGAELPTAKVVRENRESQMHNGTSTKLKVVEPERPAFTSIHRGFWALLQNPPFVFTTLAGMTEFMFLNGLSIFASKYAQNAFRISSSRSGILAGTAGFFGFAGGVYFSGFVCRCFRLKVKGMLRFSFGMCVISTFCITMVLMSCGQTSMAGVHIPYTERSDMSLYDECNSGCHCTTERFEISCDDSGMQYFSPCFAGCTRGPDLTTSDYSNCSCVPLPNNTTESTLTPGRCDSSCPQWYWFLVILFLYIFTTIAADIPAEQAVLRSIDENHRTIMCGANRFIIRVFGAVPGAFIMGAATDAGCLVWQTECGENTSCWLYDISTVSRNYFIFALASKCCSMAFFFCAFWFYKPPKDTDCVTGIGIYTVKAVHMHQNKSFEGDIANKGAD